MTSSITSGARYIAGDAMRPLRLAATEALPRPALREPQLQRAYPRREKTWTAEVVWSNGLKDAIDLQGLLLDMRVDFHFVDLGVIEAMQETFEEEIAPYWENKPNFHGRHECLMAIKNAVRGMFQLYLHAGYLRETIHESCHWDRRKGPETLQNST